MNVLKTAEKESLPLRNEQYFGRKKVNCKNYLISSQLFSDLWKTAKVNPLSNQILSISAKKSEPCEMQTHNLLDDSILFDFSSTTTKTNKSSIVAEIEKGPLSTTAVTEFRKHLTFSTHEIVDFMSYVR